MTQRERHNANLKSRTKRGICRQCPSPKHLHYTLCVPCRDKVKGYKSPYPRDRDRLRTWQKQQTQKKRAIVIAHYGNCCACCGEDNFFFLTIDHKHSNGSTDPRTRGATGYRIAGLGWYMKIIRLNFPDDFQILCWNCNHAKELYGDGIACPCKSAA